MDQKIFEIGLPMEAVSLYLLCCGLADAETTVTNQNLMKIWNSTPEALSENLNILESRQIIRKVVSTGEDGIAAFRVNNPGDWEINGS
jgi:hypothetical protein